MESPTISESDSVFSPETKSFTTSSPPFPPFKEEKNCYNLDRKEKFSEETERMTMMSPFSEMPLFSTTDSDLTPFLTPFSYLHESPFSDSCFFNDLNQSQPISGTLAALPVINPCLAAVPTTKSVDSSSLATPIELMTSSETLTPVSIPRTSLTATDKNDITTVMPFPSSAVGAISNHLDAAVVAWDSPLITYHHDMNSMSFGGKRPLAAVAAARSLGPSLNICRSSGMQSSSVTNTILSPPMEQKLEFHCDTGQVSAQETSTSDGRFIADVSESTQESIEPVKVKAKVGRKRKERTGESEEMIREADIRREKNTEAARRARVKRLAEMESLRLRATEAEAGLNAAKAQMEEMKAEMEKLRRSLVGGCDCGRV